jgi:hypothetical protein
MLNKATVTIEGTVDGVTVQRAKDPILARDVVVARMIIKDGNRQVHVLYESTDWGSISEKCGRAMSGNVVSIQAELGGISARDGVIEISKVKQLTEVGPTASSADSAWGEHNMLGIDEVEK